MILFFLADHLGNQLFQYAFLQTIRKNNEKIILFGPSSIKEIFVTAHCLLIPIHNLIGKIKTGWKKIDVYIYYYARKFIEKLFRVLDWLSDAKIISSIEVERDPAFLHFKNKREKCSFIQREGLIKGIRYVKYGNFQSEKFFDKEKIKHLKIKEKWKLQAEKILSIIPKRCNKVAVHIRRGDYKNYTVLGKSAMLPMEYYHILIRWCINNVDNSYFIILSNDIAGLEEEFAYLSPKIISNNNHWAVDFTIITKCEYAILSASSFGWWAAYFMENRKLVFAPKYWLGFNSKIEYHCCSFPSFAIPVDVEEICKKEKYIF